MLQERGVAAAPILTTPFVRTMERMKILWQPDRDLPVIVLPHPMQNVSDAEIEDRARRLARSAEAMLDGREPQT